MVTLFSACRCLGDGGVPATFVQVEYTPPLQGDSLRRVALRDEASTAPSEVVTPVPFVPKLLRILRKGHSVAPGAKPETVALYDSVGIVGKRKRGHAARPALEKDVWHTFVFGCDDDSYCAIDQLTQLAARSRLQYLEVTGGPRSVKDLLK